MSNHEYPFSAKWTEDGIPASDITSVAYSIQKWNKTTNSYDVQDSGIIGIADAAGTWIKEYTISDSSDLESYRCVFTPTLGPPIHPVLIDYISEITTPESSGGGGSGPITGCGTETHEGVVCDPDENPLEGVIVTAVAYGTSVVHASDTSDVLGEYLLSGLVAGHAYVIHFNKPGYWEKVGETVIA